MIELLMIFVFVGVLLLTGLTFVGFLAAFGSLFLMMLLVSFLGALIKFVPYILLALFVYWLYQKCTATTN